MERVILIKNNKKQEFSPRAAKIAIEHLGWSEFYPTEVPKEILTKTRPPEIIKPVKLIDPEMVPKAVIEPVQNTEITEVKEVKKRRTRKPK